jgi:hypothetical protein
MRFTTRPAALLLGGALLLSSACNKQQPAPNPETPAPAVQAAGPPVTEDETKQFGQQLAQAVAAGNLAQLDRMLHMNDLLKRMVSDLNLSTNEWRDFERGAQNAMQRSGFGQQLQQVVAAGGNFKFLRVHKVDGRPRALFRMISAEGALNFQDFTLARFPDGVGMEDVYIFLSGEFLSQTMRRLIIPGLMQARQGGNVKGPDADFLNGFPKISAMALAIRQGQFAQARAAYGQLPKKLQEDKGILLMYMQGLMQEGDPAEKDYLAALEKFRKLFPNDTAIDFISIDYHFLRKQFHASLRSIDRLEKAVGGDPYFDVLRASARVEMKQFKEAREAAERAIKAEPNLPNGYFVRILVALRERNHADTLTWLKNLVQAGLMAPPDIATNPEYASFVQSPQYREWQKWYAARSKK